MSTKKTGLDALLTPEESVLLLIDHQPFQFANLHSHEPTSTAAAQRSRSVGSERDRSGTADT
jgi:hypothetical protein